MGSAGPTAGVTPRPRTPRRVLQIGRPTKLTGTKTAPDCLSPPLLGRSSAGAPTFLQKVRYPHFLEEIHFPHGSSLLPRLETLHTMPVGLAGRCVGSLEALDI